MFLLPLATRGTHFDLTSTSFKVLYCLYQIQTIMNDWNKLQANG